MMTEENKTVDAADLEPPKPPANFCATLSVMLNDNELRLDLDHQVEKPAEVDIDDADEDGSRIAGPPTPTFEMNHVRFQLSRAWYNRMFGAGVCHDCILDMLRGALAKAVELAQAAEQAAPPAHGIDNTDDFFSYMRGEDGVVRIESESWSLDELKAFVERQLAGDRENAEAFLKVAMDTFHLDPEPDERLEAFLYEARCRREDLLKAH